MSDSRIRNSGVMIMSKSIEEFIGGLSFDILTTIGGISALVETGIDELDMTDEQREYFEIIQECAASLINSHDELVEFFKIQRMNATESPPAKAAHFTKSCNKPCNILIVEDEPISRKIISRRLTEMGHHITSTAYGEEAIEYCDNTSFDIVFVDLHLRDEVLGTDIARRIRENEKDKEQKTPIVALTASILQETEDDCKDAGVDKILTKPVHFKDILDFIGSTVTTTEA